MTLNAKDPSNYNNHYYGHEIEKIISFIRLVTGNVTCGTYDKMSNLTQDGVSILDNVLTNVQPWTELKLVRNSVVIYVSSN